MCDVGAEIVIKGARRGEMTRYGELWSAIGQKLGRDIGKSWRQMPMLLEYISDRTFQSEGLFVSALVVDHETNEPNEGFFRLAAAQGLLVEDEAPIDGEPWTGMAPTQRSLWEDQVEAIFERVRRSDLT